MLKPRSTATRELVKYDIALTSDADVRVRILDAEGVQVATAEGAQGVVRIADVNL